MQFTDEEILLALWTTQRQFTAALAERRAVPMITIGMHPTASVPMVVKSDELSDAQTVELLRAMANRLERQSKATTN
jgi:hypothetical protein